MPGREKSAAGPKVLRHDSKREKGFVHTEEEKLEEELEEKLEEELGVSVETTVVVKDVVDVLGIWGVPCTVVVKLFVTKEVVVTGAEEIIEEEEPDEGEGPDENPGKLTDEELDDLVLLADGAGAELDGGAAVDDDDAPSVPDTGEPIA